mgnify:CR=1 FL=1
MLNIVRPKIEIRRVSKAYASDHGPVLALRDTDLAVGEGEFVSIVGPSGCGKSTLLYIVGGFLDADGDTIFRCARSGAQAFRKKLSRCLCI